MPTAAQPLRELPEPRKTDHRLFAVRAKNYMASVGSSDNDCTTLGISLLSQSGMPTDVA
jgi:hypothetical protein